MVFTATFVNISVISLHSVLLVEVSKVYIFIAKPTLSTKILIFSVILSKLDDKILHYVPWKKYFRPIFDPTHSPDCGTKTYFYKVLYNFRLLNYRERLYGKPYSHNIQSAGKLQITPKEVLYMNLEFF
jgi:hypothetical protein